VKAGAQTYQWSTFTGKTGGEGSNDGTGAAAAFSGPTAVAADTAGNVYVADSGNNTVRKITPEGVVTTLAGAVGVSGYADGPGNVARFAAIRGIAVDLSGNVYVSEHVNHTVRKITPGGVVSTLAGTAGVAGSADGFGIAASFNGPSGLAVDGFGNVYVAEYWNHTLRKISAEGLVSTVAGAARVLGSTDGAAGDARFYIPYGVGVDGLGNLYVAEYGNSTIRKITPEGVVSTVAGLAGATGSSNGVGSAARFNAPTGVVPDGAGNLYVANFGGMTIRKIAPGGVVSTFVGTAQAPGSADGTGSAARFSYPKGVAVDGAGNLYVADASNHMIRKVTTAGVVTTLAGSASSGYVDGSSAVAKFNSSGGIVVDGSGTFCVADTDNNRIRRITSGGTVSTLAGGSVGSIDGTGTAAKFSAPAGIVMDASGNAYVADTGNHTIRKVTSAGVVTTLAGTAGVSGSTNGAGAAARFNSPAGVALDGSGNLFVADKLNHVIRKIDSGGVVSTFAGTALSAGSVNGTGGAARFNGPGGVAVDQSGNVYVADTTSNLVRKITSGGSVTTMAGSPGLAGSADGTGADARFNAPTGVVVDGSGNVFVTDSGNNLIRKITPGGVVTTIGGDAGQRGWSNGSGSAALFFSPAGIAVDAGGCVYVTGGNNNVRKGLPVFVPPAIAQDPVGASVNAGSPVSLSVVATGTTPFSYQWRRNGVAISGGTGSSYTIASAKTSDMGTYDVLVTNGGGSVTSNTAWLMVGTGTLSGNDDFTSGISEARWLVSNKIHGTMTLVGANGHASFVVSGSSTAEQNAFMFWNERPRAGADWSAEVRGHNEASFSDNGSSQFQFVTADARAIAGGLPYWNTLNIEFKRGFESGVERALFESAYWTPSGTARSTLNVPASANIQDFRMRVVYRAASRMFESWYDDTGAGTNWKKIRTSSLTGVVPDGTEASEFVLALFANTYYGPVTEGQLWADDFRLVNAALDVPVITSNPGNQTVTAGGIATFSVAVSTEGNAYQWRKDGVNISGGTGSSYTLPSAQLAAAGSYSVVVSNTSGGVTSNSAVLTVLQATAPAITQQPGGVSVSAGSPASFSVVATGTAPLSYQWRRNGAAISGGTGSSYAIASAKATDAGSYDVVVTNGAGSVTSNAAVLAVVTAPAITQQPAGASVKAGSPASFSVVAAGTAPFSYQWRRNGAAISGGTGSTYAIASAKTTDAGSYDVLVTNGAGSATSNAAVLTVNEVTAPAITQQPVGASVNAGSLVSFSVAASGTAPFTYQWRRNGLAIKGGTGALYAIASARTMDAGSYDVVVSNGGGSATSTAALLAVKSVATVNVLSGPKGVAVLRGSNALQSVDVGSFTAGGNAAATYSLIASSGSGAVVTSGTFSSDGRLRVPLRGVADSGSYLVRVSRTGADGLTETADSEPFDVEVKTWGDLAGSYELMLEDQNGVVGDGARYRGRLAATINRSGRVSGRVSYIEASQLDSAGPLDSSSGGSARAYTPVVRSFVGALSLEDEGDAQSLEFRKEWLRKGERAQTLTVGVDFAQVPPQLKAVLRDYASVPLSAGQQDGAVSAGSSTASLASLKAAASTGGISSPASRYALSSSAVSSGTLETGAGGSGYLLVQVLPSGGVFWGMRMPDCRVTGFGGLKFRESLDAGSLAMSLYGVRSGSGASMLSTTGVLGELRLSRDAQTGAWEAGLQDREIADALERQHCHLAKELVNGRLVPVYSQTKSKFAGSGVVRIDFSGSGAAVWSYPERARGAFVSSPGQEQFLSAFDPVSGKKYVWQVSRSANGALVAAKHTPGTAEQPALRITLDGSSGEFSGGYTAPDGARRTLRGVVLPYGGSSDSSAQGWLESGPAPEISTGGWRLGPAVFWP
jgi:hypothetical protein